jgi:hypothetical protein
MKVSGFHCRLNECRGSPNPPSPATCHPYGVVAVVAVRNEPTRVAVEWQESGSGICREQLNSSQRLHPHQISLVIVLQIAKLLLLLLTTWGYVFRGHAPPIG